MRTRPALFFVVLLASPTAGHALDEPALRLDAELGYACYADDRRYHGGYAGVETGYAFTDFWMVRGGYGIGVHQSKGAGFQVQLASLGVRYQLDVFEYVPWIELSPTVYFVDGDGVPPLGVSAGVQGGLGFDRLLGERWSVGFGVRYHRIFGEERFPAYLTLAARLGYRWVFGDPFAP